MRNQRLQALDNASADWYAYHFNDSLLQYDVHWRMWRDTAQQYLSPAQLSGAQCAICGIHLPANTSHEFVGGFNLRFCLQRCRFLEREDTSHKKNHRQKHSR
jgi:hypothetical protein